MSTSLIYRSAWGYELVMRALYWPHYAVRVRTIADQVPVGASVLELCCGPGTLYRRCLRGRTSSYIALDANERFVERLRRQHVDARVADVRRDVPLPPADVAIIQASLYHFLPDPSPLIDRMLAAARERVVIAEPVRNMTTSRLPGVSRLGRATDPGVGGHGERFTEATLATFMDRYRPRILSARAIPGGREKVYVLSAGRVFAADPAAAG